MRVLEIVVAALFFAFLWNLGAIRRMAGNLIVRLRGTEDAERRTRDEEIDEASAQSFPASDPPSFTAVHAGSPCRHDDPASGQRTHTSG
jgi:hypothetical protein